MASSSTAKRRKVAEKKPEPDAQLSEDEVLDRLKELFGGEGEAAFPENDWSCLSVVDVLPLIKIDNAFTLSYPCDELVCRRLMEHCAQAPYGRGSDTVLDENVRKTWHMDPEKVNILSKKWLEMFSDSKSSPFLESIRSNLTPKCPKISAKFYKLLVYEPGSFFNVHRDTQREKNHFGTIVLFFPSEFTGGELHVRHEGKDRAYSFSYSSGDLATDVLKCHAVSFFADCEHEVSPVQTGYRVALTYNLFFEGKTAPEPPPADDPMKLRYLFNQLYSTPEWKGKANKIGFILEHKYALASLSGAEFLKGKDKGLYDALTGAGDNFAVEVIPIGVKAEGQAGDDEAEDGILAYFDECVDQSYPMQFEIHRLVSGPAPAPAKGKKRKAGEAESEKTLRKGELLEKFEWEGSPCHTGGPVRFINDIAKMNPKQFSPRGNAQPTGNEGTEFELQYQMAALLVEQKKK